MSEYLALKAQIEELQGKLERVRMQELEAEAIDMRKRIIAFGIPPELLYPDLATRLRPVRVHTPPSNRPALYAWGGKSWHGRGPQPKWYSSALKAGISAERMKTEAETLRGNGASKP